ncbi:M23 family metallopeptidase [Pleionea sp. CnH1-48]|uniref:M23 family metallopeptidase n=1 Tax=Pleionea sp. CnH1-48 TaxID=2954494 RepID=UPI0020971711|nr:M23 family metallopeptidase [Pleionea sp. CnH1-48]MCO7225727.1 M23 family metallopeptidase [Pleionea sp. CnH1-48]
MWWMILDISGVVLLGAVLTLGFYTGTFYNLLNVYLIFRCGVEVIKLVMALINQEYGITFWQQVVQEQGLSYWLIALNKTLFFALVLTYVLQRLPAFSFSADEYRWILIMMIGCPVFIIIASWIPTSRLNWPQFALFLLMNGVLIFQLLQFSRTQFADAVQLHSPFQQAAYVGQGGASSLFNHHFHLPEQRFALDMTLAQRAEDTLSEKLEDYPCFDIPLYAPTQGIVRQIKTHLPDVKIGNSDQDNLTGNYVVIEIAPERFVLMAHLKQNSVVVAEGQSVKQGELIAHCGNSGNTTEPHLHLQVQNALDWEKVTQTFPIEFYNESGQAFFARSNDIVPGFKKATFVRRYDLEAWAAAE